MPFDREFFDGLLERAARYAEGKAVDFGPTVRIFTYDREDPYAVHELIEQTDGWVAFAYFYPARVTRIGEHEMGKNLYPVLHLCYEEIRSVEFDWSDPKPPVGFGIPRRKERP